MHSVSFPFPNEESCVINFEMVFDIVNMRNGDCGWFLLHIIQRLGIDVLCDNLIESRYMPLSYDLRSKLRIYHIHRAS